VYVLWFVIEVFADPEALHEGDASTAELHETPGPDTEQEAFWPFTPVALHEIVVLWPGRTRLGVAVIERFVVALVQ